MLLKTLIIFLLIYGVGAYASSARPTAVSISEKEWRKYTMTELLDHPMQAFESKKEPAIKIVQKDSFEKT